MENLIPLLQSYALAFVGGVLVLVVGFVAVNLAIKVANKLMTQRNLDPSLRTFLDSLLNIGLKAMVILSALSVAGVKVTSFIAVLGAAGLALGLALQGSLANFAGGVMILLFKPYRVGDFIEGQGHAGTVKEIQLFHTVLTPLDNRTIIIPNGILYNDPIINYSTQPLRRLVLNFGVAYGDDADLTKSVLLELMRSDERVLDEPNEPFVALAELGDSSVNFTIRAWCKASDYWPLRFDLNEQVYKTFAQRGLNIPFPQMDVHLHQPQS
jgi:small conductance mechanosensitive channel